MINHKEIQQHTQQWYEIKWGKIGGTLCKGLLAKTDTLFIDILSQRVEEFEYEESYQSDDMLSGQENEPFAIAYLEQYYGIKFEKSGWLQSEENELLGISPDAISECETFAAEAKCLARKKHMETLIKNEIPVDFIHQCVHYFTVNPKLEKLYFIAYRPESIKHFHTVLTRESIVNIGTEKTKVDMPIKDVVKLSMYNAYQLRDRINETISKLREF